MPALTPEHLLTVWEQSARRHPIDRALLLFAIAAPHTPRDTLADQPLGVRNAALMALRRDNFGARLDAWTDCAACGERLEFVLDSAQLPSAPSDAQLPLEVGGHRFQRPTSRNLAWLAGATDADAAARQLLHDCAESASDLPHDPDALRELLDAVDIAMDAADPWADLTVGIRCPACGHEDEAVLDIGAYLWDEIDRHARCLLDDIHTLALAYGWTESEILALSETRRAAYLDRVQHEWGQFERRQA